MPPRLDPHSPDEQEYLSRKYLYKPLLFVRLKSGNVAVAYGVGSRDLICILDGQTGAVREVVADLALRWAAESTQSAAEERIAPLRNLGFDLSTLDFGDL